jgi:hypothetical protein
VERTFAWLSRCRRLTRDFENPNRNDLAFIQLVSIRLVLRKLSNSKWLFSDGLSGRAKKRRVSTEQRRQHLRRRNKLDAAI